MERERRLAETGYLAVSFKLLAPAGGVSLKPDLALEPDRLLTDSEGAVQQVSQQAKSRRGENDRWWWD